MKKVLFISEYFNVAGTETFMLNVVRASDRTRFHYDFLIFHHPENEYFEEAKSLGCNFYVLCPRSKSPIRYIRDLKNFFHKYGKGYDVVHWCGGNISSIAPLWFAYKNKIKIIICHSHSSACSSFHTWIFHSLFKRLIPHICTHLYACSTLAARFFFGQHSSVIIKNGIDLKKYRFSKEVRNEYRKSFGISDDELLIGHVGRFESVKNHKFLLEIFVAILRKNKKAKLILIGKGSLEQSIKNKAIELGIKEHVLFLGERIDINRCMQAMDCFVMPSLFEGLPFVLVEAQAASLPCVISNTINPEAMLIPVCKSISLSRNAVFWADQIIQLAERNKREPIDEYLVNAGFSIENTVSYLEKVYSNASQ